MTEIIQSNQNIDFNPLSQIVFDKAKTVFNSYDFVSIKGVYEITRDGALKLLTSLPISYTWDIVTKALTPKYASVTLKLCVKFSKIELERNIEAVGTCEMTEVKGSKTMHNMIATAETRAIKRAIEGVFGAVINALILEIMGGYKAY